MKNFTVKTISTISNVADTSIAIVSAVAHSAVRNTEASLTRMLDKEISKEEIILNRKAQTAANMAVIEETVDKYKSNYKLKMEEAKAKRKAAKEAKEAKEEVVEEAK